MFSNKELERYNRHLILPEIGMAGQELLKKAKVLVVGAGGLGCPVLQYLTAAGVGTIGICDFDSVDASNLQRQILYSDSDIGKPKAEIACQKLKQINPFVEFAIYNQMLKKDNVLDIFDSYDIIVDASDNFPTRFLINDACVIQNKPLVFGAIYRFEGQMTVFNYLDGPTYRCLVPEEPLQKEGISCDNVGVVGVIPGIIGCYQANEVIKIICRIGQVMSGKILVIDFLNLHHHLIEIKKSRIFKQLTELGEYGDFCMDGSSKEMEITPTELFSKMQEKEFKVIDIRVKEQFANYHIHSENIPLPELINNPDLLAKNETIILVCEKGINSSSFINMLNGRGNYSNLINLTGGIQAWIKAGLPVISDKTKI